MSRITQSPEPTGSWDIHGRIYIDFQRAAQITWWSILQGICVTFLVEEFLGLPSYLQHGGKLDVFAPYFVASFLNIVNAWVQMSWAALISKWEIKVTHAFLTLAAGLAIAITMKQVTNPQLWFIGMTFIVIAVVSIHVYNLLTKSNLSVSDIKESIRNIILYTIFMVISIIITVLLQADNEFLQPNKEVILGYIALVLCMSGLIIQGRRMRKHRITLNMAEKDPLNILDIIYGLIIIYGLATVVSLICGVRILKNRISINLRYNWNANSN